MLRRFSRTLLANLAGRACRSYVLARADVCKCVDGTAIGCRATPSDTDETCALLRHRFSTGRCRRADGHRVREVAGTRIVDRATVLLRPTMQAGFSRTIQGPEMTMKLRGEGWRNCRVCCRKTCFFSVRERKQRLAAGARRAVVDGPSALCSIPACRAQATARRRGANPPCALLLPAELRRPRGRGRRHVRAR
jgi:hypothetical protein